MPQAGGVGGWTRLFRGMICEPESYPLPGVPLDTFQAIRRVHHGESISVLFQYD
jgi:hypothetical protein